ncbi:hypothetical protein AVEN_53630-1 [Araneus ventricosus]|uniref:Uncharacterized protein n=1 Tax=Araneus ventricosus TaxID=182803 RepID=A0A4Y2RK76_ARAVE|nr:hypothetical protein AVEN_53630-1 [Araneus ventricosus]
MEKCQIQWEKGKLGRSTFDVLPKVSTKSNHWPRQLTQFVTGPFPKYLHRFGKHPYNNCACGKEGWPFHFASSCPFIISYHYHYTDTPITTL